MVVAVRNLYNTLALIGLCLCFILLIRAETDSSCPGPTRYYEEIGCTPVFKTPESKCPEKYICDDLTDLPTDKCFANGRTYEIGEQLRKGDMYPCNDCYCLKTDDTGPTFKCFMKGCFYEPPPGCYLKRNGTDCCGVEVCPEKDAYRATCVVDGKTYKDGEYFKPAAEPEKRCFCGEGYRGENVEPFCVAPKATWCGSMVNHLNDIRANCAPIYHYTESPATSCSGGFRCQNARDAVIPAVPNPSEPKPTDPDMQCKFGNLTMQVGDELNQSTDYNSVCVRCVCEVPPVPTCRRLSDKDCDVTNRP